MHVQAVQAFRNFQAEVNFRQGQEIANTFQFTLVFASQLNFYKANKKLDREMLLPVKTCTGHDPLGCPRKCFLAHSLASVISVKFGIPICKKHMYMTFFALNEDFIKQ